MFMIGKSIGGIAVVPFTVALIPMTGEICDYALYRSKKPMDGTISSAATMGGEDWYRSCSRVIKHDACTGRIYQHR